MEGEGGTSAYVHNSNAPAAGIAVEEDLHIGCVARSSAPRGSSQCVPALLLLLLQGSLLAPEKIKWSP